MFPSLSKAEKRSGKTFFRFCHKVNFRKKNILVVFRMIFQKKKNDIIMDVIISIAAILKIFLYHFFATLHSMTVPNLMSKVFSYQDLHSGRHYVRPLPPPLGHDQTRTPRGR